MFQRWPKRDPVKHYYLVPNEVFSLGLSSYEISVYNFLLRCEDRVTYQCHPSYRTIGKAVRLSENTVRKYVASLEDKGAHPYRAEHDHHEGRPRAKRQSHLHHPSYTRSTGAQLRAAAPASGARHRAAAS